MNDILIERYNTQVLYFERYYKYTFYYSNLLIRVTIGGDSGDIYRADLEPSMTLRDLILECGEEYLKISEIKQEEQPGEK